MLAGGKTLDFNKQPEHSDEEEQDDTLEENENSQMPEMRVEELLDAKQVSWAPVVSTLHLFWETCMSGLLAPLRKEAEEELAKVVGPGVNSKNAEKFKMAGTHLLGNFMHAAFGTELLDI